MLNLTGQKLFSEKFSSCFGHQFVSVSFSILALHLEADYTYNFFNVTQEGKKNLA